MVVINFNVRDVIVLYCAVVLDGCQCCRSIVAIQNVAVLLLSLIQWFPVSLCAVSIDCCAAYFVCVCLSVLKFQFLMKLCHSISRIYYIFCTDFGGVQ